MIRELAPDKLLLLRDGYCPRCGCDRWQLGPPGRQLSSHDARVYECDGCFRRFNLVIRDGRVISAQAVGKKEQTEMKRPPTMPKEELAAEHVRTLPRFGYFRWHSHPLGWGVRDSLHDCVVAMGDKNICAFVAAHLNGAPERTDGLLKGWPRDWDGCVANGAPRWRPETD